MLTNLLVLYVCMAVCITAKLIKRNVSRVKRLTRVNTIQGARHERTSGWTSSDAVPDSQTCDFCAHLKNTFCLCVMSYYQIKYFQSLGKCDVKAQGSGFKHVGTSSCLASWLLVANIRYYIIHYVMKSITFLILRHVHVFIHQTWGLNCKCTSTGIYTSNVRLK